MLLAAWLAVVGMPLAEAAQSTHRSQKAYAASGGAGSPTAAAVKPTCGHPSLQRCIKAAKVDMKAYMAQTCTAVLTGTVTRGGRRAQDEASDERQRQRQLEELLSALAKSADEPLTNEDLDKARAKTATLRNYPQEMPLSSLDEQVALIKSVWDKGLYATNDVTCPDFTLYFDNLVVAITYGACGWQDRQGVNRQHDSFFESDDHAP